MVNIGLVVLEKTELFKVYTVRHQRHQQKRSLDPLALVSENGPMFRSDIASKPHVGLKNNKESETGDKRVKCEEDTVTETHRMRRSLDPLALVSENGPSIKV